MLESNWILRSAQNDRKRLIPETHRSYWVYLITNHPHGTLYIGVTNSLHRRVWQHKTGAFDGFSKRYGLNRLVHFEEFRDISNAIVRERALKGWKRDRKAKLIVQANPLWRDLSEGWYDPLVDSSLRSE
jgi:putative endonuclease